MQSDLIQELKKDALEFGAKILPENLQTRDDYQELIELSIIFFGRSAKTCFSFYGFWSMSPSQVDDKVYYLFRSQFKLASQKEKALTEMKLLILTLNMTTWIQSTESTSAPVNDLNLLKQLNRYTSINNEVTKIAVKKPKGITGTCMKI